MHHLEDLGSMREVAKLRCVCKAWHAAFTSIPGEASFNLKKGGEMAQLCGFMPSMNSLSLYNVMHMPPNWDMSPVSACSKLTRVFASNSDTDDPFHAWFLDIKPLPKSVMELTLDSVYTDPDSIASLQCGKLTRLKFHSPLHKFQQLEALLKLLPELKVRLLPNIRR